MTYKTQDLKKKIMKYKTIKKGPIYRSQRDKLHWEPTMWCKNLILVLILNPITIKQLVKYESAEDVNKDELNEQCRSMPYGIGDLEHHQFR